MNRFIYSFLFGFVLISVAAFAQESSQEISIIAKQFDFLPKQVEVQKGRPVKLYITSSDVTHGIFISEFKINQKVEKGKITVVEFTPDKTGEFDILCSVFCGLGHRAMKGKLIVSDPMPKMKMPMKHMH